MDLNAAEILFLFSTGMSSSIGDRAVITLPEQIKRRLRIAELSDQARTRVLNFGEFIEEQRLQERDFEQHKEINDAGPAVVLSTSKGSQDNEQAASDALRVLRRCLSVRSPMTTAASTAERLDALRRADSKTIKVRCIGRGTYGTAFEIPGTDKAIKKTLQHPQKLYDEFLIGKRACSAVYLEAGPIFAADEQFDGLQVPIVPWYRESHAMEGEAKRNEWWLRNQDRFPAGNGDDKAGGLFVFERIPALPRVVRENLIHFFFAEEKREQALADPDNQDCLIRPYLGSRWSDLSAEQRKVGRDSLRNFPLYADELETLHMDPTLIASDMALGLATAHWIVKIDMTDVEFVIASRPTSKAIKEEISRPVRKDCEIGGLPRDIRLRTMSNNPKSPDFRNRAIQLWMLDFDKANVCKVMDKSRKEDIRKLVCGTRANDPYYPKMIPDSKEGWAVFHAFTRTYIAASCAVLEKKLQIAEEFGIPVKVQNAYMSRPRDVIKEWIAQERAEMPPERYQALMELAQREGWSTPK